MQAGREMDVLIAEKVMGWKRFDHVIQSGWFPPGLEPMANIYGHEIPRYSTDIAAAWEVVEKTRLLDTYTLGEHDGKWAVLSLTYSDLEPFALADTAPLAICLAALKAVSA